MDVFAHTLWTNAGARGVNAIAQKQNKKFRLSVGWTAFWGVVPDFFAFTIPFIIALYNIIFGGLSWSQTRDHHELIGGFDLAAYLYQFSHSLIIFILVFILISFLSKRPRWEMFGWALHIIIDIFSHSISFYPTPFLFPISEYRYPYGVSWAHPVFMMVNYSFLALVWGGIALKKYFNRSV